MYYKQISDGYIVAIGTTESSSTSVTQISEEEYQQIIGTLADRPAAPDGYGYKLKTDLSWEQHVLPPVPPTYTQETLEQLSNAELEEILLSYGVTASMNKQNMMLLILAKQFGEI